MDLKRKLMNYKEFKVTENDKYKVEGMFEELLGYGTAEELLSAWMNKMRQSRK